MAKPYDPKDFYYRKAKAEGLRARSAFKIDEIVRRHRLVAKGQAVLDLGAEIRDARRRRPGDPTTPDGEGQGDEDRSHEGHALGEARSPG